MQVDLSIVQQLTRLSWLYRCAYIDVRYREHLPQARSFGRDSLHYSVSGPQLVCFHPSLLISEASRVRRSMNFCLKLEGIREFEELPGCLIEPRSGVRYVHLKLEHLHLDSDPEELGKCFDLYSECRHNSER